MWMAMAEHKDVAEEAVRIAVRHTKAGKAGRGPAVNKTDSNQAAIAEAFRRACRAAGIPAPVPEYKFHPDRRWKLDWAWPVERVALEVEGGVWTGGRHTRGAGFIRDMEKYNALAVAGWRLVRCTPEDMRSMRVLGLMRDAVKGVRSVEDVARVVGS